MICSSTILVNDKHGILKRVPCGQCINCRLNRAWDWSVRIMHEAKKHDESVFLTLTYDDDHLPENGSLVVSDLQKFFKRFRKAHKRKVRYFACGEYGDKTFRPHYHVAFFNVGYGDFIPLPLKSGKEGLMCKCSEWPFGHVHVGDLTTDSANYVAGYILKKQTGKNAHFYKDLGLVPPFCVMSRRPGIGYDYFMDHKDTFENNGFVVAKGVKRGLPRYYKDFLMMTAKRIEQFKKSFDAELARRQKAEKQGKSYVQVFYDEEMQRQNDSLARLKLKKRDSV
uniref:Replication initiator protein n=1 Tax=Dulem virus 90 TaxID=3145801 RepID=A0AAU8B5M2_9VIRU